MKQTYKVTHPIIKEISIGDRFITEDGEIGIFVEYFFDGYEYPFSISFSGQHEFYNRYLKYYNHIVHPWDIKQRLPSLKDKIDLL